MEWYNKLVISKGGQLCCPVCKKSYVFSPIFDHDIRKCSNCGSELREWNLDRAIYLICEERAPKLVKNMILYLDSLTENEAYIELQRIENMCFSQSSH